MKCYNHHDRDAFGVCKVCGKGLCLECMDKDSENVVCNKTHGEAIVSDKVLNFLFILVAIACFIIVFTDEFDLITVLLGIISFSYGLGGIVKSRNKKK